MTKDNNILDPVGVSAAAKALQEWTQTIRNLRATDERLREALLSDAAVEAAAMTYEPDTFIGDAPNADDALRDARAALASLIPVAEKAGDRHMSDHTETIKARLREDTFGDYVLLPAVHDAIDSAFVAGLQKHDGGLWELAFAAGRGAERERIVAALEADYRANVADGADGIYTDGLHDAWRLTVRRAKRDDLIKPVSGSSEPRKETT